MNASTTASSPVRSPFEDWTATVVSVTPEPLPYFVLTLRVAGGFPSIAAGQFVMIEADRTLEPFLRRAFSIHDLRRTAQGTEIEVLARVMGRGTAALSRCRPGQELRFLGPLGRSFSPLAGRLALVAGGVGSAPLFLLARQLVEGGRDFDFFYGGRSEIDLARRVSFAEWTERVGGRFAATTEDGSHGRPGLITEPLVEGLEEGRYSGLYTCGPHGLMKRVAELARDFGIGGQAALETPMGCGFGACLGCAVPHADGHWALCCKDGPVFDFSEVRW